MMNVECANLHANSGTAVPSKTTVGEYIDSPTGTTDNLEILALKVCLSLFVVIVLYYTAAIRCGCRSKSVGLGLAYSL